METLSVLYDGSCHLCFREIQHYKKKDHKNLLNAVDITAKDFKASDFNLNTDRVNTHIHGIDSSGNVFKGIDCFIEIWRRVPPYSRLIPLFENKLFRPIANKSYDVFARHIRPRLPKRKCDNGNCSIN